MSTVKETAAASRDKILWILIYSACSSSMLVINKLAVSSNGLPTVVSGAQLAVSALVVAVMESFGAQVLGPFERKRIVPFIVYTSMFAAGLFSNMKALMLTNVGAVIAARCCLPLVVCVIEWLFMNRMFPNARSCVSLAGVVIAAYVYISNDSGIAVDGGAGMFWLLAWWLLLAAQMTYGKHLTDSISMSQWERVFYTNALAIPPTIVLYYVTGENQMDMADGEGAMFYLALSCVVGVAISYSGWKCRSVITATTFTLVGVLNKMATIMFTIIVWPSDFSLLKTVSLLACVGFGLLYVDAPKKPAKDGSSPAPRTTHPKE
jgi:drug/metabolite transporter (DMT)-like permease